MRVFHWFGVLCECYRIAKWRGVKAWLKCLCGLLVLEENAQKVADFYLGGYDG